MMMHSDHGSGSSPRDDHLLGGSMSTALPSLVVSTNAGASFALDASTAEGVSPAFAGMSPHPTAPLSKQQQQQLHHPFYPPHQGSSGRGASPVAHQQQQQPISFQTQQQQQPQQHLVFSDNTHFYLPTRDQQRIATIWAVLKRLPMWYQVLSTLAIVLLIFFAPQNSLVAVLLGALHVTFGMETLWPPVYRQHLDNITLLERLAFAGYALFLATCAFLVYNYFISSEWLTKKHAWMMRLVVYRAETEAVNVHLASAACFLPAIVEAAMSVRGNVEDVFAEMGIQEQNATSASTSGSGAGSPSFMPRLSGNIHNNNKNVISSSSFMTMLLGDGSDDADHHKSHWRIQAATMLWTAEYWKQTVMIPAVCALLWRLIMDVPRNRCSTQRWNLVTFCAWRCIVAFVVFPQRFFCWVGWAALCFYFAVFGVVNYCRAVSNAAAAAAAASAAAASASRRNNSNLTKSILRRSAVVAQSEQQQAGAASASSAALSSLDHFAEYVPMSSAKDSVFLTVSATLRSAIVIPFLCIAVLTVLAGVHVVELLVLWLIVFLACVWVPAALRSFATDAMALISLAATTVLLLWLEQSSPNRTLGGGAATKIYAGTALTLSMFSAMLAVSSWLVISLSLPWRKHRIFSKAPVFLIMCVILGVVGLRVNDVVVSSMQHDGSSGDANSSSDGGGASTMFRSWLRWWSATKIVAANATTTLQMNSAADVMMPLNATSNVSANMTASIRSILMGADTLLLDTLEQVPWLDGLPKRLLYWLLADSSSSSSSDGADAPAVVVDVAHQSQSQSQPQTKTMMKKPVAALLSIRWLVTLVGLFFFISALLCAWWLMHRNEQRRRRELEEQHQQQQKALQLQQQQNQQLMTMKGHHHQHHSSSRRGGGAGGASPVVAAAVSVLGKSVAPKGEKAQQNGSSAANATARDSKMAGSATAPPSNTTATQEPKDAMAASSVVAPGQTGNDNNENHASRTNRVASAVLGFIPRLISRAIPTCDGTILVLTMQSVVDRLCRSLTVVVLIVAASWASQWLSSYAAADGSLRGIITFFVFAFALGVTMDPVIVDFLSRLLSRCVTASATNRVGGGALSSTVTMLGGTAGAVATALGAGAGGAVVGSDTGDSAAIAAAAMMTIPGGAGDGSMPMNIMNTATANNGFINSFGTFGGALSPQQVATPMRRSVSLASAASSSNFMGSQPGTAGSAIGTIPLNASLMSPTKTQRDF